MHKATSDQTYVRPVLTLRCLDTTLIYDISLQSSHASAYCYQVCVLYPQILQFLRQTE